MGGTSSKRSNKEAEFVVNTHALPDIVLADLGIVKRLARKFKIEGVITNVLTTS